MNTKPVLASKLNTLFLLLRFYNENYIYNKNNKRIYFISRNNIIVATSPKLIIGVVSLHSIVNNKHNTYISKEKAIHIYLVYLCRLINSHE